MNEMSVSLELAQVAMRLEHLRARVLAENVARLGAGSPTLFALQIDNAYAALREAALSPTAAGKLAADATGDLDAFAGLSTGPLPANVAADDLLLQMTRASSRYQALADGIGRQYSLMTLAIRGAR